MRRWLMAATMCVAACGRISFDPLAATRDGAIAIDDSSGGGLDTTASIDAGLPAGLVGWYPFEAAATSDDVIANHDGMCGLNLCPQPAAGHIGGGVQFDGIDDCFTVSDAGQLQLPQITLAIWANQATGGTLSHVSKRVVGGSVNSWQLETEALGMPANSLSFTTYDNSGFNQYARTAANTIVLGTWQHLAATYDGTTKRVYINGIEQASVAEPTALPYDNMPMMIGCDDNNPISEYYNGTLDDLQIYNRALSATEIADLAAR
ncbi:MAG TPA: LamG domain-containing protein [Kofleriaceae bacterium]|nr:LamG domain-containing protein [Kofleriaceae bacterium]